MATLNLNFIPLELNAEDIEGYEIGYESREQLRELREKYRASHILRREGDIIQIVPIVERAQAIGRPKRYTLDEHFVLYRKLVHHKLVDFFREKGFSLLEEVPSIRILREKEERLQPYLKDTGAEGVLYLYPQYDIETKLIVPHGKPAIFGILINCSARNLIKPTVNSLISMGLDLTGKYVVTERDELSDKADLKREFRRKLEGKFVALRNGMIGLDDYRESPTVPPEQCFLESRKENVDFCIRRLVPDRAEEIINKKEREIFEITSARNQVERLEKIREWLEKSGEMVCVQGVSFKVKPTLFGLDRGTEAGKYAIFNSPDCVLRPGGTITVPWPVDQGLIINGPYDTESFTKKTPRIAVLSPRHYKGETEQFIRQLKDGVSFKDNTKNPFSQGFLRKFRLARCDFQIETVDLSNNPAAAYKDAIINMLRDDSDYDLAIIVTREEFHNLFGSDNPYFVAKSLFMSHGIPTQGIEVETMRSSVYQQRYILNNIALACYAKIGGIPWVLSTASPITHELIFGIGSSIIQKRRLSESERVIGITTVFSGDGNYLLTNTSREVDYEHYQEALLASLRQCLEEVEKRLAWQPGDRLRLIFHQSFKRYRRIEAAAVKKFIETISDYETEYAFVHVSSDHTWRMFDRDSGGAPYWLDRRRLTKGECVPNRGLYTPLGPQAALLTLVGPHQLKHNLQGCPSPVLISLHEESTFNSLEYLSHQIFKLSFMSWRSFFPSTLPVTIFYSDLIARLLGQLRNVDNWNPDILATKLRDRRWFL